MAPPGWRRLGPSAHVLPQFRNILRTALPGSIDATVDADDVFDMLIGAIWTRIGILTVTSRHRPIERIVDMICRLLRPCRLQFYRRQLGSKTRHSADSASRRAR
ncbi:hypothetical protein OG874_33425 [Nocardia sp. NBC_00565]|uniref:hypothetical protein n=1 Tax=Nocardia sp. NBC_00565 TaxID=2975993 RepID=UPI002E7FD023|nr:hypothetical protein [Nocardia sp. NBC_00565]WUC01650.1 hypothetical protein OG874_33425 [Nocardia sp. NBC_00565]